MSMTAGKALEIVGRMAGTVRFIPSDPLARVAIAELLDKLCATDDEGEYLYDHTIDAFREWSGAADFQPFARRILEEFRAGREGLGCRLCNRGVVLHGEIYARCSCDAGRRIEPLWFEKMNQGPPIIPQCPATPHISPTKATPTNSKPITQADIDRAVELRKGAHEQPDSVTGQAE